MGKTSRDQREKKDSDKLAAPSSRWTQLSLQLAGPSHSFIIHPNMVLSSECLLVPLPLSC